jgi:hypothetical protein
MEKITIAGNKLDAGDVTEATGYGAMVRGDEIYLDAILTPQQVAAAEATLRAYTPDPAAKPGAIRVAALQAAQAVNGTQLGALTAAQVRTLVLLLYAERGFIHWGGSIATSTIDIPISALQ